MSFIQVSGVMRVSLHEAEMAKKDAEIERLKAELQTWIDLVRCANGELEDADCRIAQKDAEIERLKASHKSDEDEWDRIEELLNNEIASLKSLITELADALESIPIVLIPPHRNLVQKARETTGQRPAPGSS